MNTTHGGEVIGEGVGMAGFQLLNEELDVGGDKLLLGSRLSAVVVGVEGGHAFGLRPTKFPATRWPNLVETWLRTIELFPK